MIQNMSPCDSTLYMIEAESTFRMSPQIKSIFLSPGKIIKKFCEGIRRNTYILEHLPKYKNKDKRKKFKY